jgi:hypothetical protein
MIEVHIGLPKDSGSPEMFDGFEFRSVFDTRPGTSAAREYEGHGVDGDLASIGTAWVDLSDLSAHVDEVAPRFVATPGARWEFEAVGNVDVHIARTALHGLTKGLETQGLLASVPAPDLERHFKVADGRSAHELLETMSSLLVGHGFFELTTFGPERPKAIVTIAANELDEIAAQTTDILDVLQDENPTTGSIEHIIGAYRPLAA